MKTARRRKESIHVIACGEHELGLHHKVGLARDSNVVTKICLSNKALKPKDTASEMVAVVFAKRENFQAAPSKAADAKKKRYRQVLTSVINEWEVFYSNKTNRTHDAKLSAQNKSAQ